MCHIKVSIIGLGFVGSAIHKSFNLKGFKNNINLFTYDKFKDDGIGNLNDCLETDIMFLALPTVYKEDLGQYDKKPILETCIFLSNNKYKGAIIIKSTIEPETTYKLSELFTDLQFIHNPEFLTARTAFDDFHNQTHIVLGKGPNCSDKNFNKVIDFYNNYYPDAEISLGTSLESESMKSFVNCFYSIKVQFFTELYLLCKKNGSNYDTIKNMMLKNNWINPMHTNIPGPDGQISYGGLCFPKDTNALNKYMLKNESPNKVLEATIKERNEMRNDNCNSY
jgi:UDP-glucose 6-dehydrogenase